MLRLSIQRLCTFRKNLIIFHTNVERNSYQNNLVKALVLPCQKVCTTAIRNAVEHHIRRSDTKSAKSIIAEAFTVLRHKLKVPALRPTYITAHEHGTRSGILWRTTLTLKWPETLTFEAQGSSKKASEEEVAEQAVRKLQELGILSESGKLLVHPRSSREIGHEGQKEQRPGPATDEYQVSTEDLEALEKAFTSPKSILIQAYIRASGALKDPNLMLKPQYYRAGTKQLPLWRCMYHIKWPEDKKFCGLGVTRAEADRWATLTALHWLHSNKHLHRDGYLVLYTHEEYEEWKDSLKSPCPLNIDPKFTAEMKDFIDCYNEMKPVLDEDKNQFLESSKARRLLALEEEEDLATEEEERELEDFLHVSRNKQGFQSEDEDGYPVDLITGRRLKPLSSRALGQLNEELYDDLFRRRAQGIGNAASLPIKAKRREILDLVERSSVVVLSGDTGCGKSTQMPQFLLDEWAERGQGAECNIIVTQPRRLAAVSLAQTVARDFGEKVGDRIGYQIRLNSVLPKRRGGRALFCSTGILLRKLQMCPDLSGISHLIIDEVHERDVLTDFLLILIKDVLQANPSLKVVLMSASLNADLLSQYFQDAPLFHVSGRLYPVRQHFLPDVLDLVRREGGIRVAEPRNVSVTTRPLVDLDLVAKVIRYIDLNRPVDGAILCFLPGWQDIKNLYDRLKEFYPSEQTHWILPVHSRLSQKEQERIFDKPNGNIRKIVLATNIAETSLTIKDVVYVVDPGIHKELRYSQQHGFAVMENHWISKANVQQRKGRAGRVQPGESFHLFTREKLEMMDQFPQPEILRIPLEKVVIDIKAYDENIKAEDFLRRALEPPSSQATQDAIRDLQSIGVLDDEEHFTWLGRRISNFTTDPRLAKALVYSVIFRCVDPVVSIVAALTAAREPWELGMDVRSALRAVKQKLHPTSDHLALVNLIKGFRNEREIGRYPAEEFCRKNKANFGTLHFINGVRRLLAEHLYDADMLDSVEAAEDRSHACNTNSRNEQLVNAVLLKGIGNRLLRVRKGSFTKGVFKPDEVIIQNGNGNPVAFLNDGVNGDEGNINSPFLFYFHGVYLPERKVFAVRDSSQISALVALLMAGSEVTKHPSKEESSTDVVVSLDNKPHWKFVLSPREADQLLEFRRCMDDTSDCLLRYLGQEEVTGASSQAITLHRKQVDLLARLLQTSC